MLLRVDVLSQGLVGSRRQSATDHVGARQNLIDLSSFKLSKLASHFFKLCEDVILFSLGLGLG